MKGAGTMLWGSKFQHGTCSFWDEREGREQARQKEKAQFSDKDSAHLPLFAPVLNSLSELASDAYETRNRKETLDECYANYIASTKTALTSSQAQRDHKTLRAFSNARKKETKRRNPVAFTQTPRRWCYGCVWIVLYAYGCVKKTTHWWRLYFCLLLAQKY